MGHSNSGAQAISLGLELESRNSLEFTEKNIYPYVCLCPLKGTLDWLDRGFAPQQIAHSNSLIGICLRIFYSLDLPRTV